MSAAPLPPGAQKLATLAGGLGKLAEEVAVLQADMPNINDALRAPMLVLLDVAAETLARHTPNPGPEVMDALGDLLAKLRGLAIPARDPVLGDPTPTLERLRKAKGLIATSLMDCQDAARALGWEGTKPALPESFTVLVPRHEVAGLLPALAQRLDAVAARLDDLTRVRDEQPAFPRQAGLINVFVNEARLQVKLGKLQLGGDTVDFAALWRVAERLGELTADFYATVVAWVQRLSKAAVQIAESLSKLTRRVVGGVASAARWVMRGRRASLPSGPVPEPPPQPETDDPFNLAAARKMIEAGHVPPPSWRPYLTALDVGRGLEDLTPLASLTALQSLDLTDTQVSDLTPLAGLTALQSLILSDTQVRDLRPLAGLTALQSLNLSFAREVRDLTPLAGLTALQDLVLSYAQVRDLTPLGGLTTLQSLNLMHTQVRDLTPLGGLTALQSLDLSFAREVRDLTPLAGLTTLQSLNLTGTPVSDLKPLEGLTALQSLFLMDTQVRDLTPLAGLTGLQSLFLMGTQVSDLRPLAGLTALQSLILFHTPVSSLAPLAGLKALRSLDLRETRVTDKAKAAFNAARDKARLPRVEIR